MLWTRIVPGLPLYIRGKKLRARREFSEALPTNHCVTIFPKSIVRRILGGDHVEAVEIERAGALKPFQMAVQGVLIRIGFEPNTDFVRGQLELDDRGYVIAGSQHETTVANVFAIGDGANPLAPTISGAIGSGATAAKVIASRLNR